MIEVIVGTDRPDSKSLVVSGIIAGFVREAGADVGIIDLRDLNLAEFAGGRYMDGARGSVAKAVHRVNKADGVHVVIPEYNGSYPGILKLFIDYWRYPETFEHRPVALTGLGGRWGGLRAVEHMQQVFGYRNAYVFPNRVFLNHVDKVLTHEGLVDLGLENLLRIQAAGFVKFIHALKNQGMDANSLSMAPEK